MRSNEVHTGMGEAITFEYAKRGWNVVATMRDTAKANPAFTDLANVRAMRRRWS
ncbi:hypothetical protein [Streptomyces sp. NPDC047453]|uniref:hypothetical protein n=1 Tax=Streptomyces sp. NPDC047453 TaxID=3154812 RepID=UPI0033CB8F23